MALADRADDARRAVEQLEVAMSEAHEGACIDLVDVAAPPRLVPQAEVATRLAQPAEATDGQAANTLIESLTMDLANFECPDPVTHVAFVSDLPQMRVSPTIFAGSVIWWQVGAPLENTALTSVRVAGGALSDERPSLIISAQNYGDRDHPPRVLLEKNGARADVDMVPDLSRTNGWIVTRPYPGAGPLTIRLTEGGSYNGDDFIRADLPELDRLSVDWQIDDFPRPGIFDAGGQTDLLVADYDPGRAVPEDRPVVLFYPGWSGASGNTDARIGAFVQGHPLLDLLNFDVLEPNLPVGLADLPPGFDPVLLDDSGGGRVIVAMRRTPTGILLPAPSLSDPNHRALGLTMLGNALRVALAPSDGPVAQSGRAEVTWLDRENQVLKNPLWESDTNRALAAAPDLTALTTTPRSPGTAHQSERDRAWVPWLLLLTAAALLLERAVSLRWGATA